MNNHKEIQKQSSEDGITDGIKTISYVANSKGDQELVPGPIWQPVNIVNRQAWLEIGKQIDLSKGKVAAGRVSCLHYYMTANQMDTRTLAKYTCQFHWLVCLHIVPFFFNRLRSSTVNKYAEIFKISSEDLIRGELKPPVYNNEENEDQPVD